MTYKVIKNKSGRYIRIEFGDDSFVTTLSDVPELFEDITFERLDRMGIDYTDLEIVEVKLVEI